MRRPTPWSRTSRVSRRSRFPCTGPPMACRSAYCSPRGSATRRHFFASPHNSSSRCPGREDECRSARRARCSQLRPRSQRGHDRPINAQREIMPVKKTGACPSRPRLPVVAPWRPIGSATVAIRGRRATAFIEAVGESAVPEAAVEPERRVLAVAVAHAGARARVLVRIVVEEVLCADDECQRFAARCTPPPARTRKLPPS